MGWCRVQGVLYFSAHLEISDQANLQLPPPLRPVESSLSGGVTSNERPRVRCGESNLFDDQDSALGQSQYIPANLTHTRSKTWGKAGQCNSLALQYTYYVVVQNRRLPATKKWAKGKQDVERQN